MDFIFFLFNSVTKPVVTEVAGRRRRRRSGCRYGHRRCSLRRLGSAGRDSPQPVSRIAAVVIAAIALVFLMDITPCCSSIATFLRGDSHLFGGYLGLDELIPRFYEEVGGDEGYEADESVNPDVGYLVKDSKHRAYEDPVRYEHLHYVMTHIREDRMEFVLGKSHYAECQCGLEADHADGADDVPDG